MALARLTLLFHNTNGAGCQSYLARADLATVLAALNQGLGKIFNFVVWG